MEIKYRCLTCNCSVTQDEYHEHKCNGHVTLEYIVYPKPEEDK